MSAKSGLRRELKNRLAALPPESFAEAGRRAAAFLTGLPLWDEYQTLLLFLSIKNEINTLPLLEAALGDNKKVFVPRIEGEDMNFCRIFSSAGPWREGPLGIREPAAAEPAAGTLGPADFPALIFVPGLGFDRRGNRLGQGKGYYDRFLAALDRQGLPFTAIGLCLEAQILPEIPAEAWDRKMDGVCAGAELLPP